MRKLVIKNVEEVEAEAVGLVPALARVLAAVVIQDGSVTTTEYLQLIEVATALGEGIEDPAMPAAIALRALAGAEGLEIALRRLAEAARDQEEEVRRAAFERVLPLLRISGDSARENAARLAEALGLVIDLDGLGLPQAVRVLRPPARRRLPFARVAAYQEDERLLAILAVAQAHGHTHLVQAVGAQLAEGNADLAALRAACAGLAPRLEAEMTRLAAQQEGFGPRRHLAEILCQVIGANVRQIEQRLGAMIRRIDFQKETFREDVRTFLDDPINGVELVVREMVTQDDPLDRDIWECFANTTHGRGVQLRYGELQRRYEAQLALLKEELMQFREELIANRATFLKTIDPSRTTNLAAPSAVSAAAEGEAIYPRPFGRSTVPSVRRETWLGLHLARMLEIGDLVANGVLVFGGLIVAGGAIGLLGEVLSLEEVLTNAVALGIGFAGPLLLASLYKWQVSPEKRRIRNARRRRVRILARLDLLMADTVATHDRLLDGVVEEFFITAEQCLSPLVHATQRTLDVVVLQDRWLDRSVRATRESVRPLFS